MFLKRLVAVLLYHRNRYTGGQSRCWARRTFAAILGGFAGSVSGAFIGTTGRADQPDRLEGSRWSDTRFIVGAPVGSSLTTISWSVDRLEGSVLLSIAGSIGGVAFPYALSGLIANVFPANDFNPSGIVLMLSLPLYSAFGAVLGYNYPRLISGDLVLEDLSTTVK